MRVALSFTGCHRRGGLERVMLECANFLQGRGHETHLYATDWDENAVHPGVIRHPVEAGSGPSLLQLLAFVVRSRRELRRSQPPADVLATFGVVSPPGGVLWVQSVHRAWLDISGRERNLRGRLKQKANLAHPFILSLERHNFGRRRYRKLIALTEQVKADLMRFYGVPDGDIVVLPNGFAPDEFSFTRTNELRVLMRRRLGYTDAQKVVIFAANELERKGFGPLLRAIASLKDPNICLLAVGKLNPSAYASEISRLGMTPRVQFVGPSSDVATYYAAADVFALPTQYEAWGLVIVEAMACGLPVLTSRLAGAAVTVREGETGWLLDDPRDTREVAAKLVPLLEGAHAARAAISESVAGYAWSRILLRYEQILAECAA